MDKKLKAKWVKALRSGEYKQAAVRLRSSDGFCCLGVLREIATPGSNEEMRDEYLLTRGQLRRFGITDSVQRDLAELNDDEVPFPVIAGFIQENL